MINSDSLNAAAGAPKLDIVPFPKLPGGVVDHPKLGRLHDDLGMHLYAMKHAEAVMGAAVKVVGDGVTMHSGAFDWWKGQQAAWSSVFGAICTHWSPGAFSGGGSGNTIDAVVGVIAMLAGEAKAWRSSKGLDAELTRLKGEHGVLVNLLVECDKVLSTLAGESDEETAGLDKLRAAILAATAPYRPKEADLLSFRADLMVGSE